jgi:DNA-binding transcriptional MerR regulator
MLKLLDFITQRHYSSCQNGPAAGLSLGHSEHGNSEKGSAMSNQLQSNAARQDVVWVENPAVPDAVAVPAAPVEFTISELSREFGVTLRTLRFYEDKGLISPRRQGLTRLYSPADRDRIALILKGKKLGFMLGEIRQMVAAEEGHGDSHALKLSREKCLEQIELLNRQQADIEDALVELRQIFASLSAKMIDGDSAH